MIKKAYCFTGHRPQSLPCGFDETHPACLKIKHQLKRLIKGMIDKKGVAHFISGGATRKHLCRSSIQMIA